MESFLHSSPKPGEILRKDPLRPHGLSAALAREELSRSPGSKAGRGRYLPAVIVNATSDGSSGLFFSTEPASALRERR